MIIPNDETASHACFPAIYPTVYLNDDQCEALGITTPPAPGTVFMLRVRAVAISVTAQAEEADEVAKEGGGPDVSMTLELTDIDILHGGGKDAASLLYGGT
jgi:hypothetical protein